MFTQTCGINSAVECQLPKLKVASSNLVSRSTLLTAGARDLHEVSVTLAMPARNEPFLPD